MLKDATHRRFDVLLFWSIDRLGRSNGNGDHRGGRTEAAGVAIYVDKEAVDAITPHGRAMLQMAAVIGELERSMIRERVMAGPARAKAETPEQRRQRGKKAIGRPKVVPNVESVILARKAVVPSLVSRRQRNIVVARLLHDIQRQDAPFPDDSSLG